MIFPFVFSRFSKISENSPENILDLKKNHQNWCSPKLRSKIIDPDRKIKKRYLAAVETLHIKTNQKKWWRVKNQLSHTLKTYLAELQEEDMFLLVQLDFVLLIQKMDCLDHMLLHLL